ncbi:DUF881 domain-containing protein [Kineosporia sp. J2-2]|uniref:DUF881 domain-containing protein n=1 Tax=Kineosporia corallincola TaxID=2835133 RepID=A0ABS5TN00_9ACTN|nr:DUF881 domain-containing protein [Kineosporia corallincola]MBT0772472.1 DUF881 domain-containing protein [Kineosporia corallincola]
MTDEKKPDEKKPDETPVEPPPSRPVGAGRSRVIRPAGARRPAPRKPVAEEEVAPEEAVPEPEPQKTEDDETGAPAAPVASSSSSTVRKRLTRLTRVQLLAALLLGALGFGLVVQARQTQSGDLSSLSQSELVRVLDDVSRQGERLDAETKDLEATQNELRSGTDSAAAAEKATRERLAVLGILAGTDPAQGPGVTITIQDPQALVDAATILDTVQELRDAGAEAVQFGQVRVVASTSFTASSTGGAVITDGVEQSPPYRLVAIGDPATMESALNIPGGVLETLHQVGASGTVQRSKDLTVSAVRQVSSPTYAVPQTDTED